MDDGDDGRCNLNFKGSNLQVQILFFYLHLIHVVASIKHSSINRVVPHSA